MKAVSSSLMIGAGANARTGAAARSGWLLTF